MRLTDLAIKRLPVPEKGQKAYFERNGFGIRVSQGGSKSFILMYGSRRQIKTLGKYPAISLKEARVAAQRFQTTIDPSYGPIAVNEAKAAFLKHCEAHNRPRTVNDYRRLLKRHLPAGQLQELDRRRLLSVLEDLRSTPGEQAHATTVFNIFLNWCVSRGYISFNPISGVKKLGRIEKRDRVLSGEEIKTIWPYDDPPFTDIVKALLLTGQRRGEVVGLQQDWIAFDSFRLPANFTKNHREHIVPFGDFARPYIKPYRFNGWGKSKRRMDEKINIPHWTLHDLRRTYATVHAELGTPIHITEKLLNHVSGSLAGVAGIYNRHNYLDEMRAAQETYERHIATLVNS